MEKASVNFKELPTCNHLHLHQLLSQEGCKDQTRKNHQPFVKAQLSVIEISPPTNLTLCLWPNYTAKMCFFIKEW